jgi:hypothetical protein
MDDKHEDGGPAFPLPSIITTSGKGMTLEDYFAGQVLAGVMIGWSDNEFSINTIVTSAYEVAGAMIVARAKHRTNQK